MGVGASKSDRAHHQAQSGNQALAQSGPHTAHIIRRNHAITQSRNHAIAPLAPCTSSDAIRQSGGLAPCTSSGSAAASSWCACPCQRPTSRAPSARSARARSAGRRCRRPTEPRPS
eukprot:296420-Prymnesium_polylepis.1